jgi:tetratricopeptide (TPR) repeat protein
LERALDDANESLSLKPTAAEALNCRALIYLRMNRLDESIADYNTILGIPPELYRGGTGNWDIASAWYGRGMAERRRHSDVAAILDFAAATAVAPTIANTFAGYGFDISDQTQVYGQQIGDMNPIEMAPHFDSFVAAFYKIVTEQNGRVTASTIAGDSIDGMLEAAAINPSDLDSKKICATASSPWSNSGDEVSKSLSCFFLVLHHAVQQFSPEQDTGKYELLIRGAIYGLEKSAH